jgi:hypothetical protein
MEDRIRGYSLSKLDTVFAIIANYRNAGWQSAFQYLGQSCPQCSLQNWDSPRPFCYTLLESPKGRKDDSSKSRAGTTRARR